MGIEIERKFLVKSDLWKASATAGIRFRQGYLSRDGNCSVRVRIEGDKANINIKSAALGVSRQEFEYTIPPSEAEELLTLFCPQTVSKKRYLVDYAGHTWEVDVFEEGNSGLVVAEIELTHADEDFERPPWVGNEVSDEARYYNTELSKYPFSQWKDDTS